MRVSYEWLKSMVDVPADPAELVAEFTRTGTEVEPAPRSRLWRRSAPTSSTWSRPRS